MKLTEKHFEEFKIIVTKHMNQLVPNYRFYFRFEPIEENLWAKVAYNIIAHNATFILNSEPNDVENFLDLERTAKHEVAHVILAKLDYLAGCRYIQEREIQSAVEGVCRIMEKLL